MTQEDKKMEWLRGMKIEIDVNKSLLTLGFFRSFDMLSLKTSPEVLKTLNLAHSAGQFKPSNLNQSTS